VLTLSTNAENQSVLRLDLRGREIILLHKEGHYDIIYTKQYVQMFTVLLQYNKTGEFLDEMLSDSEIEIEKRSLERISEEPKESSESFIKLLVQSDMFGSKLMNSARYSAIQGSRLPSKIHERKVKVQSWKHIALVLGIIIILIMSVILSQKYINTITLPELHKFKDQNNPKFSILKRKANE